MADNGKLEVIQAEPSTLPAVGSRDIMDILKELHIALGKSLQEHVDPLVIPVVDRTVGHKGTNSPEPTKTETFNPLELFRTLQREIDELESAFENIAAETLVKKICKAAKHSLSEARTYILSDGKPVNKVKQQPQERLSDDEQWQLSITDEEQRKLTKKAEEQRRAHAMRVYAKVWKDMQFLARFLCDVQPLGTTTEKFYKTTMKNFYGTGYVNPNLAILKFDDLPSREIMCPPSMLIEYLQEYDGFIKHFLKRGIALLESEQTYLRDKYANIATLATFFSSITASTLQFSFDQGTSNLWVAINTLWFLSLVSSIASAANALLAITWHKSLSYAARKLQHSTIKAPADDADVSNRAEEDKKRTETLDRWFVSCPMTFLVASGALFMIGLVLFTFASLQHPVTRILVVAFVSCHALCTSRLSVELLAVRWGELKDYVGLPINSSFVVFLETLLKVLRFTSAPLFFVFDLFSLKGWNFLDSAGNWVRKKVTRRTQSPMA